MIKLVTAQKEQKSEEDWFLDFNVPSAAKVTLGQCNNNNKHGYGMEREREGYKNRIKRLKESDSKMHIYM